MVWSRTVLDGIIMCVIFNVTVALLFVLPPNSFSKMLPGTEHCKAWNTKEWMLTLAIPEHCLGWPLVICPLVGLICAGIGTLIR